MGVLRGGSWFRYARYARSSYRKFFHPDGDGDATTAYINDFGCRLVIKLDDGGARRGPPTGARRGSPEPAETTVNYTPLARSLVRYPHNPVLKVGEKGASNDQTLGCFTVLADGDTFRLCSEGTQYGKKKHIGMATSKDGITWKSEPEPLLPLGPEGRWDSQSHAGPCVLRLKDGFHMWYLGSGPYKEKTAWRVGHATSPDGLKWARSGEEPVLDIGNPGDWDGGTFMHFDVVFRGGKFLFWYAAAPTEHGDESKMTIRIGHGSSK